MKTIFSLINALVFLSKLSLFAQDTLTNLPKTATRTINKYSSGWGYYTGHNGNYIEEFAEKYYINGNRTLLGVLSEHTGVVANNNNESQFNVYSVGNNKLPGNLMVSKTVIYGDINLSGNSMITIFNVPALVSDSFFVSFNLTDYAHGGFDGDTIGLLYGVDGSRPSTDLSRFGRNAVRHHSHGSPIWKDFYSQNFTPIKTHFAIYPILVSANGIDDLKTDEFEITNVFPNPFTESLYIKVNQKNEVSKLSITIYNDLGQIVKQITSENFNYTDSKEIKINTSELISGRYILFIKGNNTGLATQIIKK